MTMRLVLQYKKAIQMTNEDLTAGSALKWRFVITVGMILFCSISVDAARDKEINLGKIDLPASRFWERDVAVSPDARHMAYVRQEDDKMVVVTDGVADKRYAAAYNIHFGAQGTVGYLVFRGDKQFAVIDGEEGESYSEVSFGPELFGPDGKRFAYRAKTEGGAWVIATDAKLSEEYEDVTRPVFLPESGMVVYAAKREGKWFIVVEGKEPLESAYALDHGSLIVVSAKSDRIAYSGQKDDREAVIVDGKAGKEYDLAGYPIFSPDGSRFAYVAGEGDKRYIVCDEKEEIPFGGMLFEYRFSASGRYFGYGLYEDEYRFVINGRPSQKCGDLSRIGIESLGKIIFSSDEKHQAFWGPYESDDTTLLFRDGMFTNLPCGRIFCAAFSPDSKHLVYVATENGTNNDEERITIGVDEKAVWRGRGRIMTPDQIVFLDENTFRVGIFQGKQTKERVKGDIIAVEISLDD